jgi:putative chitinase
MASPTIEAVLKAVAPNANDEFIRASANAGAIMLEFGIKTEAAQAQLIGHMAVECAGFRVFEENLNYSAERLVKVWSHRYPTVAAAQPFAHNPHALANSAYNGRMGNRPGSDDGWNFRGSGALQHTGASEFGRVERRTGRPVIDKPGLLRAPANADAMWRAACSYFVDRNALAAANAGDTLTVTKKINGGTTGLADRKIMVQRAERALMGGAIVVGELTAHEQVDDTKRRATQATAAAPAGGAIGGGATEQATRPPAEQKQEPAKPAEPKGGTLAPSEPPKPAVPPSADHTAAIVVGVIVFTVIAAAAVVYWHKHFAKKADLETMQLQAKESRLALASS